MNFFSRLLARQRAARMVRRQMHMAREINRAIEQSKVLLENAAKAAEEIITHATLVSENVSRSIEAQLFDATRLVNQRTGEAMDAILKQNQHLQQHLAEQLERSTREHLEHLAENMRHLLNDGQERLDAQVTHDREVVSQKLQQYVAATQQQARERLTAQLPAIVADVVGRAIPLREHERLVEEALERVAADLHHYEKNT